jgi:hypothetical protein
MTSSFVRYAQRGESALDCCDALFLIEQLTNVRGDGRWRRWECAQRLCVAPFIEPSPICLIGSTCCSASRVRQDFAHSTSIFGADTDRFDVDRRARSVSKRAKLRTLDKSRAHAGEAT